MLEIIVRGCDREGRSTLAALVANALNAVEIPLTLVDGEAERSDALHLSADSGRLARNAGSISGRLKADPDQPQRVVVRTQRLAPELGGSEVPHAQMGRILPSGKNRLAPLGTPDEAPRPSSLD